MVGFKTVPEVELSSGHKMPMIGMGTAGTGELSTDQVRSILVNAMAFGYRHFDTAAIYGTEPVLGASIAEALGKGIVCNRDELFITTKLWVTETEPQLVLPALKNSLQNLGLEYVDLYLVHWPVTLKKGDLGPDIDFTGKISPYDNVGVWKAMEECSKLGLAKSIGVSNFGTMKMSEILDHCSIPPAVNQVEMNVTWKQEKLRAFCREKGIFVSAWSPLGGNGAFWRTLAVLHSPVLKEIADARGISIAQVALKWVYQQGSIVLVKSFNKERMKENLKIFEWELTMEELEQIQRIPQKRAYSGEMFVDEVNGPYKSLNELWDDDP